MNVACYEQDILRRHNLNVEDIKTIDQHQHTSIIQISFKNGDRIWIDCKLSMRDSEIKPVNVIKFIDSNCSLGNI